MSALAEISAPPASSRADPRLPSKAARRCKHCGSPSFHDEFCCPGCAYVHRLIHENGWDNFYALRDGVTGPADQAVAQARDFSWLASLQRDAERPEATTLAAELTVSIQGLSCIGCVWLIEKIFARQPGAGRIEINAQTGQARLLWTRGEFDGASFASELQRFNYLVGPERADAQVVPESRALVRRIGLCAAFAMNVMLFTLPAYFGLEATAAYTHLFATLSMGFATLSLLAGGGYFLSRAWRALRERALHIDLPIALGIVGAYVGSFYGWFAGREEYQYFDFVSAFVLLMLIGRWAQVAAVERNQRRLLTDQPAAPRVRVLAEDGSVTESAPEELQPGQRFAVASGQTVPVDATLETAEADFSLAWINGEAAPRLFRAPQRIPAGAQNLARSDVRLIAVQGWRDSLLAALLQPVTRAAFRHRLIERVIQGYLIAIIGIAALAGLAWYWTTGDAIRAGAVVTAVLVVSCPCALGLAFPLTEEIATVALRRRGVFVRTADLWPRLARVDRLVFDKTGTLTLETPQLKNPEALRALPPEAKSALLTLVAESPHPIGRCLHAELLALEKIEPLPGSPREVVGAGVELGPWRLGRERWATSGRLAALADGATATLTHDGDIIARFHCVDTARVDARGELARLAARGLPATILSGDRQEKVSRLARELGLSTERALGDRSPQEKAAWLEAHGADRTLMLGDGANDSLAFDRALVRGTPVIHSNLLEQKADFYFLGRGIGGLRALFEVDDARRRTQHALLVFMIAYNCVAVGLGVSGHMNPLFAAVLMPLSSLATLVIVGVGLRPIRRAASAA
jgi:Cu2+-exporting ATPase